MKKTIKDTDTRTSDQNQKANPKQQYLEPNNQSIESIQIVVEFFNSKIKKKSYTEAERD